jgi:hypothetical protein
LWPVKRAYAYGEGNPVLLVDPSGFAPAPRMGSGSGFSSTSSPTCSPGYSRNGSCTGPGSITTVFSGCTSSSASTSRLCSADPPLYIDFCSTLNGVKTYTPIPGSCGYCRAPDILLCTRVVTTSKTTTTITTTMPDSGTCVCNCGDLVTVVVNNCICCTKSKVVGHPG